MKTFCNNYLGWCIYFVWCIIVTVYLILYYVNNRSKLNKDKYINELKTLNFIDEASAEKKYQQIQNEMTQYINSKVTINCKNTYGRYNRRSCNKELNFQKQTFKQEYLETKLTQDDKKLINLYEDQHINLAIIQYAFGGYIIIPFFILVSINMPWRVLYLPNNW
jgi:hypothetical protein